MVSSKKFVNTGASKAALPSDNGPCAAWQFYQSIDQLWSRTSQPVFGLNGAVASSQSLATQAGIRILQAGGNAADAAIAVAAALAVTEPCSTGLGGDCFAIHYDAKTKQVEGLNGSGRSPGSISADAITGSHALTDQQSQQVNGIHALSVHAVTVPGAAAGWWDTYDRWGSKQLTMKQIVQPAIDLAANGWPVGPATAAMWLTGVACLQRTKDGHELLVEGRRSPLAGEVFRNPGMARTLTLLAEQGRDVFYQGEIARAILKVCNENGGHLSAQDLQSHRSTFPQTISVRYHDVDVHELPPNGQGIAALLALNIVTAAGGVGKYAHNSADHLHLLIEAMRLAFCDTRYYVTDMEHADTVSQHGEVPVKALLSQKYAEQRAKLINMSKATIDQKYGSPLASSDTVAFVTVDGQGNSCSFINSNYMGFGTGLVPTGYGFSLQNRGANFHIDSKHPNHLLPNKRPFHTIIPGMVTRADGQLEAAFNNMGGFMQPQGHVQLLVHQYDYHLSPQAAIDQPRFCLDGGTGAGIVLLETGVQQDVVEELERRGHDIRVLSGLDRAVFGRAQIIRSMPNGVLAAAADARADGQAAAY